MFDTTISAFSNFATKSFTGSERKILAKNPGFLAKSVLLSTSAKALRSSGKMDSISGMSLTLTLESTVLLSAEISRVTSAPILITALSSSRLIAELIA